MKQKIATYQKKTGWKDLDAAAALDSRKTLVLAFCGRDYEIENKVIQSIIEKFPNSEIVGCSTAGEVCNENVLEDSIVLTAMKFEKGHFAKAVDSITQASESFAVGQSLANKLKEDELKGVFILSDGLNANGSELIRGFNSIINTKQIVTSGCLAGDSGDFKRTWLINERRISSGIIIALGFYGDVICAQGSKGGWDQFGIERRISKSEGNIVFEIDDKPALDLYEEYLGEKSKELPASGLLFPMQIRSEKNYNQPLIRTLLGIDRIKKSLTFAGDMPLGRVVQLMKANFERLVQGAADAAIVMNTMLMGKTKNQSKASDTVTIVVSCVGRRLVLGQRTDEELEAIQNESKFATNMIGIYSYGELASYEPGAECELHNQSMTLFAITEAA